MHSVPAQLREHEQELQTLDVSEHFILYRKEHWNKRFNDDQDFVYVAQRFPQNITRANIVTLTREAQEERNFLSTRRLFLATMIWGYGTVGYGPHRTWKALQSQDANQILQVTFDCVISGNIHEAYRQFNLKWCGPAFFTKYFYFIGCGSDITPTPLIFDAVVCNAFEKYLGLDIKQFANVTRDKRGIIKALGRNVTGYKNYLAVMHDWACQLHCQADSIEFFLFKTPRQGTADKQLAGADAIRTTET